MAVDSDGDFVVVWHSYGQDGEDIGLFARRFSSAGAALATEFQVASYTSDSQAQPSVAMAAGGDFVVAWHSVQNHYAANIFMQRFSSAGSMLGGEVQVNAFTIGNQINASVSSQTNGDFVVTWDDAFHEGFNYGVFARRFSSSGLALEDELQVNTYVTADQSESALGMDANGDFVVAWKSGHDGEETGIFAQRFGPLDLDIDGDGTNTAVTDGVLAIRWLFGFRGSTLIDDAIGTACTRCDAPSIEAYLAEIAQ
jgi:hypothetical protein